VGTSSAASLSPKLPGLNSFPPGLACTPLIGLMIHSQPFSRFLGSREEQGHRPGFLGVAEMGMMLGEKEKQAI
jgi:hypothetical protein